MPLLHRLLRKPFFGRFEVEWRMPESAQAAGWERVRFDSPNGARLPFLRRALNA
jgi:hypothetical protein